MSNHQAVGNGRNMYYEGPFGAEEPADSAARLALVRERDALRADLATEQAKYRELFSAYHEACADAALAAPAPQPGLASTGELASRAIKAPKRAIDRLQAIIDAVPDIGDKAAREMTIARMAAALDPQWLDGITAPSAAHAAPAATVQLRYSDDGSRCLGIWAVPHHYMEPGTLLYTRSDATNRSPSVSPVIPDGYALVPIEPTEEMLAAAHDGDREYTLRNFGDVMTVMQGPYDHWAAMIAAAPEGQG